METRYVKTLQIARVWMMMVDAVVLDLSFKACKYGGALLVFSSHAHMYICASFVSNRQEAFCC